jgi:hypothetical protein
VSASPQGDERSPWDGLLSFTQKSVIAVSALRPQAVDVVCPFTVRGAMSDDELQATISRLVSRQDALRYRLIPGAEEPRQEPTEIEPTLHWTSKVDEAMTDGGAAEAGVALSEALAQVRLNPFVGRMFAAGAVRWRDCTQIELRMHHVVADLWSLHLLPPEFEAARTPAPRPALDVTQRSHSARVRRAWDRGGRERFLAYWTGLLEGSPPLVLPAAAPFRPRSGAVDIGWVCLPVASSATLAEISRRHGASGLPILLGAVSWAFQRLTGQRDIDLRSIVSGRTARGAESTVGCMVNAIHVRVRDAASAGEAVRQSAKGVLAGMVHQNGSWLELLGTLDPTLARSATRPSVQVEHGVSLDTTPTGVPGGVAGIDVDRAMAGLEHRASPRGALNDMEVRFSGGDPVMMYVSYRTDLWTPAEVEGLCRAVLTTLAELQQADAHASQGP